MEARTFTGTCVIYDSNSSENYFEYGNVTNYAEDLTDILKEDQYVGKKLRVTIEVVED